MFYIKFLMAILIGGLISSLIFGFEVKDIGPSNFGRKIRIYKEILVNHIPLWCRFVFLMSLGLVFIILPFVLLVNKPYPHYLLALYIFSIILITKFSNRDFRLKFVKITNKYQGMKFPLFFQVEDEIAIFINSYPSAMVEFDKEYIDKGLYKGWDVNGQPLKVTWDDQRWQEKIEISSEKPEPEILKEKIHKYLDACAACYAKDKDFVYDRNTTDFVKLYQQLQEFYISIPILTRIYNDFKLTFGKGIWIPVYPLVDNSSEDENKK